MQPRQDPRPGVKAKLQQVLNLGPNVQIEVDFSKDYQGRSDYNGYTFTLKDRNGEFAHENDFENSFAALQKMGLSPELLQSGTYIHLNKDDSRRLQQPLTYAQPTAGYPSSSTAATQPQMQQQTNPKLVEFQTKLANVLKLGPNIRIEAEFSTDYQGNPDGKGYIFTLKYSNGEFAHEKDFEKSLNELTALGFKPYFETGVAIRLDSNDSRNLLQLGQPQSYAQRAPAAYPPSATARTQPQVAQPTYYQQPSQASFYPAQQQSPQQNLPLRRQTGYTDNIMYGLQQRYQGLVSVEIGADEKRQGECVIFIKFQSPQDADRLANQIGDQQQGNTVLRSGNRCTLIVGSERAQNMLFGPRVLNLQNPSFRYTNMKNDYWATSQNAPQQSPARR